MRDYVPTCHTVNCSGMHTSGNRKWPNFPGWEDYSWTLGKGWPLFWMLKICFLKWNPRRVSVICIDPPPSMGYWCRHTNYSCIQQRHHINTSQNINLRFQPRLTILQPLLCLVWSYVHAIHLCMMSHNPAVFAISSHTETTSVPVSVNNTQKAVRTDYFTGLQWVTFRYFWLTGGSHRHF